MVLLVFPFFPCQQHNFCHLADFMRDPAFLRLSRLNRRLISNQQEMASRNARPRLSFESPVMENILGSMLLNKFPLPDDFNNHHFVIRFLVGSTIRFDFPNMHMPPVGLTIHRSQLNQITIHSIKRLFSDLLWSKASVWAGSIQRRVFATRARLHIPRSLHKGNRAALSKPSPKDRPFFQDNRASPWARCGSESH